jgi:hypothetical protein
VDRLEAPISWYWDRLGGPIRGEIVFKIWLRKNSCVNCGFEVRFKLIQFSRVTVINSASVMEAEEFSSNHANNNGVVTPNGLPLGCISGRENSSNTGSVEIDEVDTTAQLEEGHLQWKLVSINGKPWWRLVLVHARLNVAYEGGFGEIQACTSLPMVGGAPVFLMTVSRANVAKVGFTPCYNSFTAAPTFYSGGLWSVGTNPVCGSEAYLLLL